MSNDVYTPFKNIKNSEIQFLNFLLEKEHPQVTAMVLSFFEKDKAELILENFDNDNQIDIKRRIAGIDQELLRANNNEIPRVIEQYLEKKLNVMLEKYRYRIGGINYAADILSQIGSEPQIMKELEEYVPDIAQRIKRALDCKKTQKNKISRKTSALGNEVTQADNKILSKLIQKEHPQAASLILSILNPDKASEIILNFNLETQCDIIRRIAGMKSVNTEVIRRIYAVLEKNLAQI
ncbi:MAG: hypothetical protein FWB86_11730, partial [Treponema sp.]|nr:hypothetical protein [Treponema sp.]